MSDWQEEIPGRSLLKIAITRKLHVCKKAEFVGSAFLIHLMIQNYSLSFHNEIYGFRSD